MEDTTSSKKLPIPCEKKRCRGFFEKEQPFPILPDDSAPSSSFGEMPGGQRKIFIGQLEPDCVIVKDKFSIKTLFSMGFFGKSTLTNRTPLACLEHSSETRQQGQDADMSKDTVTLESGSDSSSNDDEDKHWKRRDHSDKESEKDSSSKTISKEVEPAEKLQLTFEEAYFLSYALGVLVVLDNDQPMDLLRMWHKLCDLTPDNKFPVMYTAYHHLRSKGWVVRSGLKYGVDYVLYKDGPLYYHSTYAVVVKPTKERNLKDTSDRLPMTWKTLSAMHRVVSHAGKALMFLYVIRPEMMSENKVSTPFCVSNFKVEEVIINRWVPESGREETTYLE